MTLNAAVLALVLSQEGPATEAPAAVDAGSAAAWRPQPKGADDAARLLKRWPELKPEERAQALELVQKQYGNGEASPVLPPNEFDFERYAGLPTIDQARVTARHFFNDLMVADAPGALSHCGFPFMLEDRRIDRAEDLRNEWQKALRGKRTDLIKLYDLDVLAPADMEKKYGAPPRRLQAWNWRAPNTWLAVANFSGHAAVVMLRQVGAAWQVVGYHD